jgi:hypothetical protein
VSFGSLVPWHWTKIWHCIRSSRITDCVCQLIRPQLPCLAAEVICRGTVRAAGIVTECSTSSYDYDFSKATEAAPGLTFLVNYTVDNLDASRTPQINLSVLSTKMGTDCAGRGIIQRQRPAYPPALLLARSNR